MGSHKEKNNSRHRLACGSSYEHRHALLAVQDAKDAVHGLIMSDHIDWNTGAKFFQSDVHLRNWLSSLADKYGRDTDMMLESLGHLKDSDHFAVVRAGDKFVLITTVPKSTFAGLVDDE